MRTVKHLIITDLLLNLSDVIKELINMLLYQILAFNMNGKISKVIKNSKFNIS